MTESGRALAALYDSSAGGRPRVTYAFLAVCLLVTVPTMLDPRLYELFGGLEPRRHWWQPFTAAFEHGWPGFHASIHLVLNTFLILECGRPCERLLGSGRFLMLCLLSLAANAMLVNLTDGVNGSSLVIWSWGPPLFAALLWARRGDSRVVRETAYGRIRGILVLMYVVIALAMGVIPFLAGWRGNPLVALLRANLFHLVATAVGVVFTLGLARYVGTRLSSLALSEVPR